MIVLHKFVQIGALIIWSLAVVGLIVAVIIQRIDRARQEKKGKR